MTMAHYDDVGTAGPGDPASGPTMRECVKLLLVRFPHISPVTFRRLQMQETFRELCEEYVACVRSVERLAGTGPDDALRAEYGALSLRLEGEMLRYIAEHGGSSSP
jgi:hypothetical protein